MACRRLDCTHRKPCARCAADHAVAAVAEHTAYYERTGHCAGCGQPGDYCQCSDRWPCGCRDLHEMGSGLTADALALYAVQVSDDQGKLFTP